MHLVQVDREERKDERFTITSILARRIAMGWDPHNWHCIAWWSCLWFSWWDCWSANSTDDHCLNVISYGATREEEEDSVSISSRFLINIIANIIVIIANIIVIRAAIIVNILNVIATISINIATILIKMNMLKAKLTTGGEMLTIRQSFGADDRAELTITTIWELTIITILLNCVRFVAIAYQFNPIWCRGEKHTSHILVVVNENKKN